MPLINYQINLILTSSANCVIPNAAANQAATFSITDTKLYVQIGTLSAQDNAKLLQQLKSGFKRTISWNKYQKKKKKKTTTECTKRIFRLCIWSKFSGSK